MFDLPALIITVALMSVLVVIMFLKAIKLAIRLAFVVGVVVCLAGIWYLVYVDNYGVVEPLVL